MAHQLFRKKIRTASTIIHRKMRAMNASSMCQLAFILQTSALDSPARSVLLSDANKHFHRLLIASGIVAIGILFEWPDIKKGLSEWWRTRPSKLSWLARPPRRASFPGASVRSMARYSETERTERPSDGRGECEGHACVREPKQTIKHSPFHGTARCQEPQKDFAQGSFYTANIAWIIPYRHSSAFAGSSPACGALFPISDAGDYRQARCSL